MRNKTRGTRNKKDGFYIVEAMIALGLLTIGFLGMITLLAQSLGLNRVVSDTYTANYLAMEGMELVKNVIDGNIAHGQNFDKDCAWNEGFSAGASYEVDAGLALTSKSSTECPGAAFARNSYGGKFIRFDAATGKYGYGAGTDTPFKRKITVRPNPTGNNPDEIRVNSIVDWVTRGGGEFTANVEDYLFNWQRK